MFNRRTTLAAVCLATAMLMLDIAVVNTALTHIARSLHTGVAGVQWVVDAYTLALAATVLTAESLSDRFGRRRALLAGLGLFTVASATCAVSPSTIALDVARAFQGIGGAAMFATSLAVLADAFDEPEARSRAFAAYGATIGGSFAIGPLVGGALTTGLGWRSIFYLNIPVGLLCAALTVAGVRESRDPRPRRVDVTGQATLCAGLFLLVLALLRGNSDGWSSATIVAELTGAAVLLATFVVIQQSNKQPMMPLGLFANRSFTGAQVAAFAISASFFATFFYAPIYLQAVLHMSPLAAGLVYRPSSLLIFAVSGASAQLLGRVSLGVMISGGLALVSAGLILCLVAGTDTSWVVLLPGLLVAGVGTGLFNPALSAVALGEAPPELGGLAAGTNDTLPQHRNRPRSRHPGRTHTQPGPARWRRPGPLRQRFPSYPDRSRGTRRRWRRGLLRPHPPDGRRVRPPRCRDGPRGRRTRRLSSGRLLRRPVGPVPCSWLSRPG
jgi:EmrB/QacA subfamily drug resistance transporter